MAGHLGSFGRTAAATAGRRRLDDEGALDKAADRIRSRDPLKLRPPVKPTQEIARQTEANERASAALAYLDRSAATTCFSFNNIR
jgi:hypothetical protein